MLKSFQVTMRRRQLSSKIDAKFCIFNPLWKLGEGGQDVRIRVSSSAKDPTSGMLFVCAGRFNIFWAQILGVGTNSPQFLRDRAPNYTKFWEDIHPSSMLPLQFVWDVRYVASFRNWSASQSKIRPNLDIFDPVKTGGRCAKYLNQN